MKNWLKDLALVKNLMAGCYMVQDDYENAENCLQQSLSLAKKTYSEGVRQKALNNLAVLFRIQGEYEQALACLKQTVEGSDSNEQELFLYYLNTGKTFIAAADIDSAAHYLSQLEALLQKADVKAETKASAYSILCQFTENRGDVLLAEKYRAKREELLSEIIYQRQEQTIYRIQKQYDYESLQNEMNRKLIRKQRLITFIGIFTIIGLTALAISQIRLAKTRKQEAETKANLFHFMQQNKELAKQSEEQKQNQIYLAQKHKESEQAYEELLIEKQKYEQTASEYGEKLSLTLKKEQSIMLRLHLFLQNQGDDELLKKLEKTVFGKQAHLDAMMETVDRLYPQLREIIKQEDLGLDENEQLDVIMSYFNISRQDEALLLDKTTDMVDKIRNRSRKKIQSASEGNNLPKIK
jgi:tetratricopeptide (TPR) repeat protein